MGQAPGYVLGSGANREAQMFKSILVKYDNLFGFSFPYMMVMHQRPTDGADYGYYHYHSEF